MNKRISDIRRDIHIGPYPPSIYAQFTDVFANVNTTKRTNAPERCKRPRHSGLLGNRTYRPPGRWWGRRTKWSELRPPFHPSNKLVRWNWQANSPGCQSFEALTFQQHPILTRQDPDDYSSPCVYMVRWYVCVWVRVCVRTCVYVLMWKTQKLECKHVYVCLCTCLRVWVPLYARGHVF